MRIAKFGRLVVPAMCLAAAALWAGPALAASTETVKVDLSGQNQVPAVDTQGSGTAEIRYNPTTRRLSWTITYTGLSSPVTQAHLHGPAAAGKNGKVEIYLTKKGSTDNASPIKGSVVLTAEQATDLTSGMLYINVHTQMHASGEIRGQLMLPSG